MTRRNYLVEHWVPVACVTTTYLIGVVVGGLLVAAWLRTHPDSPLAQWLENRPVYEASPDVGGAR